MRKERFVKDGISKNTKMVAPNGMPGFEVMASPQTNVDNTGKVTSPVARKV